MKRILSYIFIAFGLVALWASTSRTAMKYITDRRDNDYWWGTEQLNHGDLASLSSLYFLNKFYDHNTTNLKRASYTGAGNIVLFIHGDSNLMGIEKGDSVFAGVSALHFILWNGRYHYHLDTSKRNILILEIAESLVRDYYQTTEIIDELCDTSLTKKPISAITPKKQPILGTIVPDIRPGNFFNKYINQNLQCNLFNYNFMMPMFGSKAALNYYLFDRASGDVVISDNKQYLLFKGTLSPSTLGSAVAPVSDDIISHLIANFNTIYNYYKSTGFSEVYMSIVPNAVTIIQPEGYNNVIPRIQNDPRLKMKVIDIYSAFKQSKETVFKHGDTHWNNTGKQMWFDMVNKTLTGRDTADSVISGR